MVENNLKIDFDAFLRSFKQNKDGSFAFLLGAGASITSGIQSAEDCVWDWKKQIYISNNPSCESFLDIHTDCCKKNIQMWLDEQGIYPKEGSQEEYVFYAEKTFPLSNDRTKYFKNLCFNKTPNIGYKLLCLLHKYGVLKSVWTTNFDGLVERAAHQANITPICVNLNYTDGIYSAENKQDLLYVALHGDYKYSKLKNTYLDVFPTLVNKSTNRIHAYFNQTVTATGRLSSSEPNLQNIPVKGEEGKDIRNTFISEKGNLLISADYSQIELRLLAHFSKDPTLVEAFKNNDDIHKKTAMKIYSVSKEHITPSMRNTAKIINFSIIYGKTAFGLSKELDIKRKEADEFIKSYFETYSQVKPFCEEAIKDIKNKGYVRTMMGRIRDLSKTINSSNSVVRNEAERMALNTLIQGSAADMIKVAMIGIHREFKNHFKTAKIVMQVHDELVVEVSEEESDRAMKVMKDIMEHSVKANVPIVVDIHKGKSWGEIH